MKKELKEMETIRRERQDCEGDKTRRHLHGENNLGVRRRVGWGEWKDGRKKEE